MSTHGEERPLDLGGVPAEEGISPADAAERLDQDPDEQGPQGEHQQPEVVVEDVGPRE